MSAAITVVATATRADGARKATNEPAAGWFMAAVMSGTSGGWSG
jgi:hypothetical protein